MTLILRNLRPFAVLIALSGMISSMACAEPTAAAGAGGPSGASKLVFPGPGGKLRYTADKDENTIPDFSNCGYGGGGVRIPIAPVKVTLEPVANATDDTARIQAAIDQLAKMPPDSTGLRGAVLLKRGRYKVADQLTIAASGIVLRGEGDGENGTVLVAAGKGERDLIDIQGRGGAVEQEHDRRQI